MRVTLLCISLNLLFAFNASSQIYRGQIDSSILPKSGSPHYEPDYILDHPVNAETWTNEKHGLHAAFGSAAQLYFRTEVPEIKRETNSWEATGFPVDETSQQALADVAAAMGVELFVLDDGWFQGRTDDTAGLGDW
ncbi:MAG: alpha-galactosidase, partial [Ginsengibacter sp.]